MTTMMRSGWADGRVSGKTRKEGIGNFWVVFCFLGSLHFFVFLAWFAVCALFLLLLLSLSCLLSLFSASCGWVEWVGCVSCGLAVRHDYFLVRQNYSLAGSLVDGACWRRLRLFRSLRAAPPPFLCPGVLVESFLGRQVLLCFFFAFFLSFVHELFLEIYNSWRQCGREEVHIK